MSNQKTEILKDVMQVVKWSNNLPIGADRDLCSSYPLFGKLVKKHEEKIVKLMNTVLKSQSLTSKLVTGADEDAQNEFLSDCIDNIMEKVGLSIDDAAGVKKNEMVVINASVNHVLTRKSHTTSVKSSSSFQLITAKLVTRPQINFKINNKNEPFVPKITEKPNALRPLAILYEPNEAGPQYSHPYEFELEKFKPSSEFLVTRTPFEPKPLEETELIIVDNEAKLKQMMDDLEKQLEIAVDLEHHSYRSYLGLACLVQISTRTIDYIVDSLALWDKLQCLNSVFTNPKILKVLHGADRDIEWLQRDLGVYIVNMFDTYHAAKLLQMSRFSLAHLLSHYMGINVNKTFQLADWRIRPLPADMVQYAREDTHYLLYVYDLMRNQLIEKSLKETNLLQAVFENSRHVCLTKTFHFNQYAEHWDTVDFVQNCKMMSAETVKRYDKPRTHAESHLDLYRHSKKMFNPRQMAALKELYLWRDKIAREEDESTGFVLPNHQLLQISEYLPREMQGLLACCNPVPTMVKQHIYTLHQIVLKARDMPLDAITQSQQESVQAKSTVSALRDMTDDLLTCVHDFSHHERSDEVATLLNDDLIQAITVTQPAKPAIRLKSKPDLPIFAASLVERRFESEAPLAKKFITPYARYVKYMDLAAAKAKEAKEKQPTQAEKTAPSDEAFRQRMTEEYLSLSGTNTGPAERKAPPTQPAPVPAAPIKEEKLPAADNEPLRNSVQKSKKNKQKGKVDESANPVSEAVGKEKGKKRKSGDVEKTTESKKTRQEPAEEIAPFSYENADFSAFDEKFKRKPEFTKGRKNKKQGQQQHAQRHGAKSMTYTKKS